ncbi:PilW family protein [Dyella acidiphila]|uniref:PilW family protein n=1 Tax=Dyella acidiphila TaxID=2775866 RepID=A0ABR9G7Q1_9GAMM|nr:PilW family protein [Dyella acidiphila]MBE1160072.1 PilW family protein [Dyella acidiphila]
MMTTRAKQHGLSLISLLIALTIGIFLLAGLFDLWLQTRNTFNAQGSLSQLQDNERMALSNMASIVQSAGFYPLAENYGTSPPSPLLTPTNVFTISSTAGSYTVGGQYIYGTSGTSGSTTAPSDTLYVRFMAGAANAYDTTASTANALDCLGQTHSDRALVTNQYYVDPTTSQLMCKVTDVSSAGAITVTPAQPIINDITTGGGTSTSGIYQMTVTYGVDPTSTGSVTQYMSATTIASDAYWMYVRSMKIQLIFANPLGNQAGQKAQLPAITRIVAVPQTTVTI